MLKQFLQSLIRPISAIVVAPKQNNVAQELVARADAVSENDPQEAYQLRRAAAAFTNQAR